VSEQKKLSNAVRWRFFPANDEVSQYYSQWGCKIFDKNALSGR
jgi:hypothetical protein